MNSQAQGWPVSGVSPVSLFAVKTANTSDVRSKTLCAMISKLFNFIKPINDFIFEREKGRGRGVRRRELTWKGERSVGEKVNGEGW
jgi:hypothetical protein